MHDYRRSTWPARGSRDCPFTYRGGLWAAGSLRVGLRPRVSVPVRCFASQISSCLFDQVSDYRFPALTNPRRHTGADKMDLPWQEAGFECYFSLRIRNPPIIMGAVWRRGPGQRTNSFLILRWSRSGVRALCVCERVDKTYHPPSNTTKAPSHRNHYISFPGADSCAARFVPTLIMIRGHSRGWGFRRRAARRDTVLPDAFRT